MKKKLLSIMLSLVMAFSALIFVSCEGTIIDEDDPTKTNIYVGVYDGGFGIDGWEMMARKFEELYANESFEEGKTGVSIHVKGNKDKFLGSAVEASMDTNIQDIYFTTLSLNNVTGAGKVLDVTDVVTDTLNSKWANVYGSKYGDTKTIADNMIECIKDYTLVNDATGANKYYGVPVYVTTQSLVYDVDLWESDDGLYFTREYEVYVASHKNENNCGLDNYYGEYFTTGLTGAAEKSYGQDGEKGTLDDGLPITFFDFKIMLNQIYELGYTALSYAGSQDGYVRDYFNQFYANYQGYDEFQINLSFDGITDIEGEDDVVIDKNNGYKVLKQKGRYKALEFAQYFATNSNNFMSSDCFSSVSHTDAQNNYLYSVVKPGVKRVAMFLDGNWWEHEARNTIDNMATKYPDKCANRRFGVMTFPDMEGAYNEGKLGADREKIMLSIQPDCFGVIAKRTKFPELCKLFLAYTSNAENMSLYTSVTGAPRPYKYEMLQSDYDSASYYKKAIWDNYKGVIDGTTKILYTASANKIVRYMGSANSIRNNWGFNVVWEGKSLRNPFQAFHDYSGLTPSSYVQAVYDVFGKENGNYWKNNFAVLADQ